MTEDASGFERVCADETVDHVAGQHLLRGSSDARRGTSDSCGLESFLLQPRVVRGRAEAPGVGDDDFRFAIKDRHESFEPARMPYVVIAYPCEIVALRISHASLFEHLPPVADHPEARRVGQVTDP